MDADGERHNAEPPCGQTATKRLCVNHAANAGRHAVSARGHDLYETPAEAVEALLRVETLPDCIWEPAWGPGAIVRVLRQAGHRVYASDLVDYGCPDSEARIDFLLERALPDPSIGAIVTNPPFKLADKFVTHALTLCPCVIMLLRFLFLERQGRSALLDDSPLTRVHLFKNRLRMMHRHNWPGPRASSSIAFAGFAFERGHRGSTQLDRISWLPITDADTSERPQRGSPGKRQQGASP